MQTVIDEATGRRVRKASRAATEALKEHAHWLQHNPYRMNNAANGDAAPAGTAIRDAADAAADELAALEPAQKRARMEEDDEDDLETGIKNDDGV